MKVFLSLLFSCFMLVIRAQEKETYSKEIQANINKVENNLISWVKLDSSTNWNIYERMKELHVNGVSIAVINNYKIEWAKSYGWADSAEKKSVTNNTLFQLASIGKSLNAFGQMLLVQDKKVDLEKDINSYLKSWKFPYDSISKGKKITLANLLSHTAGLTVHGFDGYNWNDPLPTIYQTLNGEKPANNPPVRSEIEPGIKSVYSGGGITISELMLQDITGMRYEEYMKKNVFLPLGMPHTAFSTDPPYSDFATGYRNDEKIIEKKYMRFTEKACGGALWSTASDLAKFIIEIQLSLKGKSNKVLDSAMTRKMLTPYLQGTNAAFGCFIDTKGDDLYFQHSGLNPGYSSQYFGSFEGGKGVVVLVNADMTDFMGEVVNSVATVYNWENFYDYTTKKIVTVPSDTLKQYVGKYQFEGGDDGPEITFEQGSLYLKDPHSPAKWRLYFTSNNEFFMLEARWANQQFFMNEKNRIGGFHLTSPGYQTKAIKVF